MSVLEWLYMILWAPRFILMNLRPSPGLEFLFMTGIILAVASSCVLSVILVALVLRLAHIKSWYDRIDERKIHTGDVPRIGGIGFALAFMGTASVTAFLSPERYFGIRFIPVLFGMLLTLILGIFDDFRPLRPKNKMVVQIIAGLCVVIPGFTFERLFFFDIGAFGELNWITYPLTIFWIVGLTNAINFIDGVDGLGGGVCAIIALTYGAIFAFSSSAASTSLLCICLAAAILGFLVFNMPFPRARIFMGDGGALFLGFTLAVLPLLCRGSSGFSLPLPYAAALLLIPILDTTAAVWRRVRERRRIDSPDRSHVHHKLMNLGFTALNVDGMLYGLQIILGVLVFISIKMKGIRSLVLLFSAYVIGVGFFTMIHFVNRTHNRRLKSQTAAPPILSSNTAS
jgi:UDP-GlcNAc:undecaprenyl-phosphate GlcNAc-1-phosphate transferase